MELMSFQTFSINKLKCLQKLNIFHVRQVLEFSQTKRFKHKLKQAKSHTFINN